MKNLWRRNDLEPYLGSSLSIPFERLDLWQRSQVTKIVGYILSDFPKTLIEFHQTQSAYKKREPRLPCVLQDIYMCKTQPSFSYSPSKPKLVGQTLEFDENSCWALVHKAMDEFIATIKTDPSAAEPLVAFLKTYGCPPEKIDRLMEELRREVP